MREQRLVRWDQSVILGTNISFALVPSLNLMFIGHNNKCFLKSEDMIEALQNSSYFETQIERVERNFR